ncbi:MAG: hypothetical protein R6X25_06320 [Candidatus Krumholzibacteriia bacterium]
MTTIKQRVLRFVEACRCGDRNAYRIHPDGPECLYASCYAAMITHDLGIELSESTRQSWIEYIRRFQDPDSGYFLGPELTEGRLKSAAHSREHLSMHLTAHVLPALAVLGGTAAHPLRFMDPLLAEAGLRSWLEARDWDHVWIEGNNLLFVGQFLTYIQAHEQDERIPALMEFFFDWLDARQDPRTGFWGTDRGARPDVAMYGAYHQLLLYHCWRRPVRHPQSIIDSTLALQHFDGGYSRWQDAGTCAMVDGIDILVNFYKLVDHRRREIRRSLRRAVALILEKQTPRGGFEDMRGQAFHHMGMEYTETPVGSGNLFSTWFFTHALCLAGEILGRELDGLIGPERRFNTECSMGWHRPAPKNDRVLHPGRERYRDAIDIRCRRAVMRVYNTVRPMF